MHVLFFARLRETLKTSRLEISRPYPDSVRALRQQLCDRGDFWHEALSDNRLLVAVNQQMAHDATPLSAGDEVAFFPPVTGG